MGKESEKYMKLKSLEIQGFKTFCDKTKIEFVDGISAVVGPNGSGKSNVSDAIRWVLGEQSVKNLRCSRLEDVIFAGSLSKKAQGFASVKLVFDNNDENGGENENKEENTEESEKGKTSNKEISVARRYYRSGESEYFINAKPVRLKDVNELFMDTGLGKDGYSMIGQGGIDAIIKAKPSERREIFEEAAKISGCKYRKEDAESRLKKADENLLRINDILSELESRVEPLRKQSESAKVYLEYFEEKKVLEISLWTKEVEFCKTKLNQNGEKLKILKDDKLKLDESLAKLEKSIEESTSNGNACLFKADELRRSLSQIDSQISDEKSRLIILDNTMESNKETIERIKNDILENTQKTEILRNRIEEKLVLLDEKKELISKKRQELDSKIKNFECSRNEFRNYENKLTDLQKELAILEQDKSNKNIKAALAESGIKECEIRDEELKNLILNKENSIKDIEEKAKTKEEAVNDLSAKIKDICEKTLSIKGQFSEKKKEYGESERNLQSLRLDYEGEIRKIKLLEDLERNMEGLSRGVKGVVLKARAGVLKGVLGTVSDILTVPSEYAVSIDISLGASVQNIITESEESAKASISFLKEEKLGRATFLPLTSIKGNKADVREISRKDGFIGIASDLCKCENRYENVKTYLLGRTLIADNIDSAIKISKKLFGKFKVVTLDGQVVNAGGSLTGGFVSGKTGLISRASEIERLKEEQKKIAEKIKIAQEKLKNTLNSMKDDEKIITEQDKEIEKLKSQKNILLTDLSKLNSEKVLYGNSMHELEEEKSTRYEKKEKLTKEMKKLSEEIAKTEDEINKINLKLSEAKELNSKIFKENELKNSEIQDFNLKIVSLEKEAEILEVELTALREERQEKQNNAIKMNSEMENLRISNGDAEKSIEQSHQTVKILENKKENLHIEIEKSRAERDNLERLSMEFRREEKEKSHENELLIKELSKLEESEKVIQKDYERVIANLWDEYEMTLGEAMEISNEIEDMSKAKKELNCVKTKIKNLGQVNLSAIDEYEEVNTRYSELKEQVDDIKSSKKELINIINGLNVDMKTMFLERFTQINKNFSEIMSELFEGGTGKLVLEDPENVLSCGINISVRIPGKKEINLEALSGGEKALVAISLYFAIIKVNPPPFCVLDEIEAALDDVNVERFAKYLRKVCEKTQFIVITHRRGTMEEADALYGVTMENEGISKLLELKVNEFVKV